METRITVPEHLLSKKRLKSIHREYICRLIGEFKGVKEILEGLKTEYGINVSPTTINWYKNSEDYKPIIHKFRSKYLMDVKSIPVSNKVVRMEELQTTVDELRDLKKKVNKESGEGRGELLMVHRRMNETLCVAREEIEGKPMVMNQFNVTQFNNFSDAELQRRKDIILAKAQKVAQMANSTDAQIIEVKNDK